MKVYLPWKTQGHDKRRYQATLLIEYGNTQTEKLFNQPVDKKQEIKAQNKRMKSGLRKCPGHKFPKVATYTKENQCSICKGYRK